MTDEETWERRWIKAIKTIAEREEVIDILKAERANLEANMRARPTGTRSRREAQLEKEVEKLRGYEQLHIQNLERLRVRNEALEAQVKRLITKEGERIGKVLAQFDFEQHLARQRAWSQETFGPGDRAKGVSDHIRKELDEIAAKPDDLEEWIDIVLLALDGAWRAGNEPHQIIAALAAKQAKNEARQWPDWRTVEPGKAIEHVRTLNERLDEPLPELRRDANGDPIPWAKEHDYFMAFDPNDPDTPTD